MKINKQFVQEVANGKYDSYDTHGEMKRAAQRILEEKVVSKFSTFCFRVFGGEVPDNVMDLYDAFVDFEIHGAEIRMDVPDSLRRIGAHQIFGMTPYESLEELWHLACEHEAFYKHMCDHEFKIAGKKEILYSIRVRFVTISTKAGWTRRNSWRCAVRHSHG